MMLVIRRVGEEDILRPIFSPFRIGLEQYPFALYIQKTAKNKGKMDKHLLRKGKTTHGSKPLEFEGFDELRTKSGEFWVLRGSYEVITR